jgi:hypothetical protein
MGHVTHPGIQIQLDTGGDYEKLPPVVSHFQEGRGFAAKFEVWRMPPFSAADSDASISRSLRKDVWKPRWSIFRAVIMNKPGNESALAPGRRQRVVARS